MSKNEEKDGGVRVLWNRVWSETFGALDAKAMKAGAVIGMVAPVRVIPQAGAPSGCGYRRPGYGAF